MTKLDDAATEVLIKLQTSGEATAEYPSPTEIARAAIIALKVGFGEDSTPLSRVYGHVINAYLDKVLEGEI